MSLLCACFWDFMRVCVKGNMLPQLLGCPNTRYAHLLLSNAQIYRFAWSVTDMC